MSHVAKLLITDADNHHLMLYRANHPYFGDDPDLPGGTLEEGEELIDTMVREAFEEIGLVITGDEVAHLHTGTDYSHGGVQYALYHVRVPTRPRIVLSWEHSTYEWLKPHDFLYRAKHANDTYMHMVYEVVGKLTPGQ